MSIRIFLEKCTPSERIPPVAQKTVVTLVDDLDGGEADETVSFGLDGSTYEIDLSSANAGKLRDALATYVGSARRSGRASGAGGGRGRSARRSSNNSAAIRAWAREQGLNVNERGRIPGDIVTQYDKAHA
jgi:nucleoid-associated protein Lsr2